MTNISVFAGSALPKTNANLLLQLTSLFSSLPKKWMIAPLLFLVIQSWALPVTTDQLPCPLLKTILAIDNNTSSRLDTTYKPAPKYGLSEEFTAKGIERTEADFENYYLQVVAANNIAAINDELTVYKNFINTHLGKRQDSTPWKIFIGPFRTRAEAKIYKINNPRLVSEDAFPCPAHTVEPIITRSFRKN